MAQATDQPASDNVLRCERCWSTEGVELFQFMATGQPSKADDETGVPLCRECRSKAPKDPLVFKEIFLRFGSPKEMMSAYSARTEREAIAKLCEEKHLEFENMMARLSGTKPTQNADAERPKNGQVGSVHLWGPFGYHYDDSGLVVMEAEAKVVQDVFNLYLNGLGIAKICRELNKRGIRTRTGKAWAPQTVANILSNPIYCGFKQTGGSVREVDHRNLISVDLFNRVQEEMQRRIRRPDQKSESCLILPPKEAKLGDS